MSIKPIDHAVIFPKSQEVAAQKHSQNVKQENIMQSTLVEKKKSLEKNKKRVIDAEKTIYNHVQDEESRKRKKQGENQESKKRKNSRHIDIQV